MREPAYPFLCPNSTRMLFLEKIVKCASRAGGANGGASGVVRFTFDGGSGHEKCAFVSDIFLGDTFQNRLGTFESGPRIEVPAILAGTKIGAAFWAMAALGDLHRSGNHRTAHRTTQYFLKPRHLHPPRNIARGSARPPLLGRRPNLLTLRAFAVRTVVLIAALPVFPFRHLYWYPKAYTSVAALRLQSPGTRS
jgi:hypothetical protein